MALVDLIAIKSMTYATRRLLPGDPFQAKPTDARILVGIKKAREDRQPGTIAPPPPLVTKQIAEAVTANTSADEMRALRDEFERVIGTKPLNFWKADTLREKIAAAATSS